MVEPLKVDSVDLHVSANHMSSHHADLRAAHADAASEVSEAQVGWVGASAAALQAKFTEWQETTTQLCGAIAEHEEAFRAAGHKYTTVDEDSAGHLTGDI